MKKLTRIFIEFTGVFIGVFITISSISLILINSIFRVTSIYIKSGREVMTDVSFFQRSRNLFFLDTTIFANEIIREYPQVRWATVIRKFPQSLIIIIEERRAIAEISIKNKPILFDDQGFVVLTKNTKEQLPQLYCEIDLHGVRIESVFILKALALLRIMIDSRIDTIQSIKCDKDFYILILDKTEVFVSQSQNFDQAASSLQFLIKQFTINDSWPKSIDLRYEKNVLIP